MDILFAVVLIALLPLVLARPYAGAVLYTVIAYFRPQNMVGGLAMEIRPGLLVLAAMAVGFGIGLLRGREKALVRLPFFGVIALLCLAMFVATRTAVFPDLALDSYLSFLQLLAGVVLTIVLCNTPDRLRGVLIAVALSLGAMAILSLAFPVWEHGRLTGAGGKFRDSNDFALALVMALPLLVYLRRHETRTWRKWLLTVPIPFVLAAIVLTGSRGGILALSVVGVGWVLSSRGRMVRLALAPIAALAMLSLAPDSTIERYTSIQSYEHDGASRDRLSSWNVALRIAEERPLTGVGPGNFIPVYRRYANDFRAPHVAHNAFLQILADAGVFTLLLFLGMIALAVLPAQKLALRARNFRRRLLRSSDRPAVRRDDGTRKPLRERARRLAWIDDYAQGLVLSLAGFFVGAQFLSRDDLDLLYLLCGLSGVLVILGWRELKAEGYAARAARRQPVPLYRARPVATGRTPSPLPAALPVSGAPHPAGRS